MPKNLLLVELLIVEAKVLTNLHSPFLSQYLTAEKYLPLALESDHNQASRNVFQCLNTVVARD